MRAFRAYFKAYGRMPDKRVFRLSSLVQRQEQWAESMGLPITPEVKIGAQTNLNYEEPEEAADVEVGDSVSFAVDSVKAAKNKSKLQRLKEKIRAKKAAKAEKEKAKEEEGVLLIDDAEERVSRRDARLAKLASLKAKPTGDDDDAPVDVVATAPSLFEEVARDLGSADDHDDPAAYLESLRNRLEEADELDRERHRGVVREAKRERKRELQEIQEEPPAKRVRVGATLGCDESHDEEESEESEDTSS